MTQKLLQEYRQVKRADFGSTYFTVQQKVLVQSGEMYGVYGPKEGENDIFSHNDPDGRSYWIPVETKWVNLPTVTAEEAKRDTL